MLTAFIYGTDIDVHKVIPEGMQIIRDPEAVFAQTKLSVDATDHKLVEVIDHAKLVDDGTFVDRFGVTLYTSALSTGCKAALLVNNTNKIVDLRECGFNAISAIFSFCRNGYVALQLPDVELDDLSGGEDVAINIEGRMFTKVKDAYNGMESGTLWY